VLFRHHRGKKKWRRRKALWVQAVGLAFIGRVGFTSAHRAFEAFLSLWGQAAEAEKEFGRFQLAVWCSLVRVSRPSFHAGKRLLYPASQVPLASEARSVCNVFLIISVISMLAISSAGSPSNNEFVQTQKLIHGLLYVESVSREGNLS